MVACFRVTSAFGVSQAPWGVALGLVLAGTPAVAEDDVCTASDAHTFEECLTGSSSATIALQGDGRKLNPTTGKYDYVDIDLAGEEKTIIAGEHELPFMRVSGGGKLVIEGGRFEFDAGTDLPVDATTLDGAPLKQMTEYMVRVYGGDTTLTFERTALPFQAWEDNQYPVALVELRGGMVPNSIGGFDTAEEGSHVVLREVWNTADRPLDQALVVTVFDTEHRSTVTLQKTKLYADDGAVLHTERHLQPVNPFGLDSSVVLDRVWVEPATVDRSPSVGITVDSLDVHPAEHAFLSSAGTLRLTSARFKQLAVANKPLVVAPVMVLDQLMVDGLEGPELGTVTNTVVLAQGRNIFVQSSLVCGVEGGESVFKSLEVDFTKARGIHLVNSAFWQLEQSVIDLEVGDDLQEESTAVVANVTLHHALDLSSEGPLPLVFWGGDDEIEPRLLLRNSYLQGSWDLTGAADNSALEGTVMGHTGTDAAAGCGRFAGVGCAETDTEHLDAAYANERSCAAAMDDIANPLLVEVEAGRWVPGRYLKDITVESLDTSESLQRPTLIRVPALESTASWKLPASDDPRWDASEWCWSNVEDTIAAIGAWSSDPEDFSTPDTSCSLPLLEPYEPSEDEPLDTGVTELDHAVDTASRPEVQPADGRSSVSSYGLAAGCRYRAAAAWLLLPLGLWRRRSRPHV